MQPFQCIAETLQAKIATGRWPASGWLPSVRNLAREHLVSSPTILKALQSLRASGEIVQDPVTRGYRLPGSNARRIQPEAHDTPRSSAMRIADILKDEILSGIHVDDKPLPPMKTLSWRFGSSHKTIQKALSYLIKEQRLLEARGKHHWVRQPRWTPKATRSVCFCGSPDLFRSYPERMEVLLKGLEREFHRRGWPSLRYRWSAAPRQEAWLLREKPSAFVHIVHGQTKGWGNFFRAHSTIPLIQINFEGIERNRYPKHRRFLELMPADALSGREIGFHLRQKEHRTAALLTPIPLDSPWLNARWQGCREAFLPQGKDALKVIRSSRERDGSSATRRLKYVKDELLASLMNLPMASMGQNRVKQEIESVTTLARLRREMEPAFRQAMQEGRTAWICLNDVVAVCARHFLASQKAEWRRTIEVIGYDNSHLAFEHGITSFDMGLESYLALVISALDDPEFLQGESAGTRTVNVERKAVPGWLAIRGGQGGL